MQALEDAAFAAWPPASSTDLAGWLLRLDAGYTKRANSLNVTERSQALHARDLQAVEAQFAARGLRPTVRLTSVVHAPDTQALLQQRGYRYSDASQVLQRSLVGPATAIGPQVHLLEGPAQWMGAFSQVSEQSAADAKAHLAILRRITHRAAWAVLGEPSQPQCCGLGVVVGEHLGLFDVATAPHCKRQGRAEQLCRALLAWGQAQGARSAFLQVVQANRPALALYRKLGFERAYDYGYWLRE